jgi:methylenetetrahydrofolate reductase (NADPH)
MARISFEYFPGRSDKANNQLEKTVSLLAQFQPEFQSVTYGAGGSDQQGSYDAVVAMQATSGIPTASHLTYTGANREDIEAFADKLWEADIKRIVALRGDDRVENKDTPFENTPEFVAALKACHPFEIAVACYPEVHPKAGSLEEDLAVLKAKQEAGATSAITQFFFDNSKFYEFVLQAREAGITIPIIPGILPIYNFVKVCEMAEACGTHVPEHVYEAFANGAICGSSDLEIASELLKAQVHDLAYAGYEAVHIYTLNKVPLAKVASEAFIEAHQALSHQRKVA